MCVAVCVAVCVGVWVRPQWGQWPMHKNFNSFWNFRSLIIIVVHNFKNHCYHIGKPVWSQWFFSMHYDDAFERIKMMRFNTSHWGLEMHRNDAFECITMAHSNASQWCISMHRNDVFHYCDGIHDGNACDKAFNDNVLSCMTEFHWINPIKYVNFNVLSCMSAFHWTIIITRMRCTWE